MWWKQLLLHDWETLSEHNLSIMTQWGKHKTVILLALKHSIIEKTWSLVDRQQTYGGQCPVKNGLSLKIVTNGKYMKNNSTIVIMSWWCNLGNGDMENHPPQEKEGVCSRVPIHPCGVCYHNFKGNYKVWINWETTSSCFVSLIVCIRTVQCK